MGTFHESFLFCGQFTLSLPPSASLPSYVAGAAPTALPDHAAYVEWDRSRPFMWYRPSVSPGICSHRRMSWDVSCRLELASRTPELRTGR